LKIKGCGERSDVFREDKVLQKLGVLKLHLCGVAAIEAVRVFVVKKDPG
jgi:hypothetical protein